MSSKRRRIKRKKKKRHIILILFFILITVFLFFEESGRDNIPEKISSLFKSEKISRLTLPEIPKSVSLPRIAIVMDDLGPNKNAAEAVLEINAPLTLSILPQEVYSSWVAEKGHKLGHEIIGHIPMEATRPLRLGKGGLYTWMTDKEIIKTLAEDIRSIPHITGISTHMGSAFTQDERVMRVFISELKKQGLFFFDSYTTTKSLGNKIAQSQGIRTLRRDVFLDDKDDMAAIHVQWKRLLKIAGTKGFATANAHPRINTIRFLKKILENKKEVKIVPLSELILKEQS